VGLRWRTGLTDEDDIAAVCVGIGAVVPSPSQEVEALGLIGADGLPESLFRQLLFVFVGDDQPIPRTFVLVDNAADGCDHIISRGTCLKRLLADRALP
jgi:hypothetical protein